MFNLRALFHKNRAEQEMDDELRFHLEKQIEQNIASGVSPEEARYAALRQFGNVGAVKEECRDSWGVRFINESIQDIRYGLRQLRRNPGFTTVAVLTLALGIGTTTAIFSVVDAVLLRPLPFSNPQQLVSLWQTVAKFKADQIPATGPNYLAWARQSSVFSALAAGAIYDPALTGVGDPEHLYGIKVTSNFFKVLSVQPTIGRAFLPGESHGRGAHVVILGYSLWQRKFGGNRSIVGKAITLDGKKFTVVGIMPGTFRFPQIWGITAPYSYVPLSTDDLARPNQGNRLWVIGRLKPGVTIGQARAEMTTIARQNSKAEKEVGVKVESLHREVEGGTRGPLLMLLTAVGFLMLIACANVANMLLGRASRRRREVAVRLALGAHRQRILRQLLTESTMLALFGCLPGIFLAFWVKRWFISLSPHGMIPQTNPISLNLGVLALAAVVAVSTGILFGLAPARVASKTSIEESLKEGAMTSAGVGRHRLRKTLVASEVALTLLLLIGTGLMIRSMERLANQRLEFSLKNVLTMKVTIPESKYTKLSQQLAFDQSVLRRVEALPGVKAAAFTTILPLANWDSGGVTLEGQAPGPNPGAEGGFVTPGYFRVLEIPLVKGRLFTDQDYVRVPEVAVVNRKFAQTYWPKQDPIGKRFQMGISIDNNLRRWYTVVGVVGNVRTDPSSAASPTVWLPAAPGGGTLIVRTAVSPYSLIKDVEAQVWSVDKDLPIFAIATMNEIRSAYDGSLRYLNALMGIFSLISLALTAVGIYAVVSYLVAERTHEIGIRMALGAQKSDVLKVVVGQGLKLALIGVAIGIAGALVLTRFLSSLLYGVKRTDPVTFVAVSLLLIAVALVACYIPARRAAKVDPMVALRYE